MLDWMARRVTLDVLANVFEPEWQFESDHAPYLFRAALIGKQSGAERLGASLYEIAPAGRFRRCIFITRMRS